MGPAGWAPSLLAVTTPEGTPTPPAPSAGPEPPSFQYLNADVMGVGVLYIMFCTFSCLFL